MATTKTKRAPARPHGQMPTITAPPTARPLLKRGSYDNTCGYYDGDPDDPFVICEEDECNCQTSVLYMGSCPVSESPTCYYTSDCYTDAKIYSSNYELYTDICNDLDDPDCQSSLGVAVCTESPITYCGMVTWTDIDVYSYYCDYRDTTYSLSFSHPDSLFDSTTESSSSPSRSSSTSKRTTTSSSAGIATTSKDSGGSSPSSGAIAGAVIGSLAILAIIITAMLVFFRKRRAANMENSMHVSKVMDRQNSNLSPGISIPAAANSTQPAEKDVPTVPPMPQMPQTQPYPPDSPAMQPLPASGATSTVVSPMSSPAPSPGPQSNRNLAHHASQLSASSYQFPQEGGGHITMPAFPTAAGPIERKPVPENNNNNSANLSVPGQSQAAPAYTSVYNAYPPSLPSFSDPPFMRFNDGRQSSFIGSESMSASWFQDRGSVMSEMDGTGSATAQGEAKNRQTAVSELMGSVPGTPPGTAR